MKRYFLFVIICFFILGVSFTSAQKPFYNKTIVIDPGHGGVDPGTTYNEIYEKDITLKISLYLREELEKQGAIVYMIREGDYDLSKPNAIYRKKSDFDNRVKIINNYADYYISVHLNYLKDSRYKGIQVFSNKSEEKNAYIVQNQLNKYLKSNRKNKLIPNNIYMYQRINKPGLLIECGFLSNSIERNLLLTSNYQQYLAKEIVKALTKIDF